MNRSLLIVSFLSVALLAGCNSNLSSSTQVKGSFARVLQAQSIGRAWDNGERALQNNDMVGLSAARSELLRLGANDEANRLINSAQAQRAIRSTSDRLVVRAVMIEGQAYRATGQQKQELKQEAAKIYRQALQVDPGFASTHPDLLNAIGYFLADRGTSKSDFVLAEKLTRRALQGIEKKNENAFNLGSDAMQLSNTRDSLAWALFRQGRFAEALREQKQAVKEAESASQGRETLQDGLEELRGHLAEIQKAIEAK
jgi:tetratricopeptide (TPR) repeat protein